MSLIKLILLCAVAAVVKPTLCAQARAVHPHFATGEGSVDALKEPVALRVLLRAVAALGGTQVWATVTSLEFRGETTSPYTATFIWKMSRNQHSMITLLNSGVVERNTGSGQPFKKMNGKVTFTPEFIERSEFVPAGIGLALYLEAIGQQYSVHYVPEMQGEGADQETVIVANESSVALSLSTRQIWTFSKSTGLPLRVIHREFPSPQAWPVYMQKTTTFANFVQREGLTFPTSITQISGAGQTVKFNVSMMNKDTPISSTLFTLQGSVAK